MRGIYARDLDLNLLRVFAVVAETGSVTAAARQLYLTQPAVSSALRRLNETIGAPLFVRSGRGLALTTRGERLRASVRLYLQKLIESAIEEPTFDPRTTTRTVRLGLPDGAEMWLLPALLRVLECEAPGMRVVALPVHFRNVGHVLASGAVDIALTVADDLPPNVVRKPIVWANFVCLHDPRRTRFRTLTEKVYFAHEHVVVSYNGDLRGVIEDTFGKTRNVRCSVPSFSHVGALVDGTARLATIPEVIADATIELRPKLAKKKLPFDFPIVPAEMLWPLATDDDDACRYVRAKLEELTVSQSPARRKSKQLGSRAGQ